VDLRVGKIVRAWPHPEADKLWCEEIDVGEDKPRMVASGLREYYTQEGMTGRLVVVVSGCCKRFAPPWRCALRWGVLHYPHLPRIFVSLLTLFSPLHFSHLPHFPTPLRCAI
jgi:hypothetical protein